MLAKPIKSELHHWWPQVVSRKWADAEGGTHQIFADGRIVKQGNPKNFGAIRNAHTIRLANVPTVWDQNFESQFDLADSTFPSVLKLLGNMSCVPNGEGKGTFKSSFSLAVLSDEQAQSILMCLLSLVVRGPKFRSATENMVNSARKRGGGQLPPASDALINLNLRDAYARFCSDLKWYGKFAFLFSGEKEFIFGDGFLHNFKTTFLTPYEPRILVPLTPEVCVLYVKPSRFSVEPRAIKIMLNNEEVDYINRTVMIYSRDMIFYRSQKPIITQDFLRREHLEFKWDQDYWLEELIAAFC